MHKTPPTPPTQFQPEKARLGSNCSYPASYVNGDAARPANGMGHMLERVHGVADRSMLPQKRRKMYDERDEQPKAVFNGGGKGGVLGDYMRTKREQGRQEPASNGTGPVSLDDEEDEVQVIGDIGEKEVCYGRIEGAAINAFRVPTPKPGAVAISSSFWPQVKIVLRRRVGEKTSVIHAVDSTRNIIGNVDSITAIGLTPLLDSKFGIRTASRILTRPRRDDDPQPGATLQSVRYSLDLNIYGPRKYALQIGKHLSHKQLWLRTPLFVEAGVELYNPHSIQKPPQPPQRTPYNSYGSRQQGPARTMEEIRSDVLGMFDNLTRTENLPEMEADPRITTELLKHQKQGLFFMTNKEKGQNFESGGKSNTSLWRLQHSANGSRTYLNIITGQEEHKKPPQVLGGILADMMGLGKTLSILSLVMSTVDDAAQEWEKLQPCSQDDRDLCPVRKSKGKAALPKIEQTPLVLNAKTTLLLCPLSTMQNWEEQIRQHIKPGALKYYVYHGPNRIRDASKLAEFDIVITTYGAVSREFANRSTKKPGIYPIDEINWFRIVLDEAHLIREQNNQQSRAICRLAANRRWAVTGTPVQNRLEDLGSLMTFLRVKPFDERGGFAQYIMSPFKLCDPEILPKLRLLVDSITLRRLKDRINLPKRSDLLVKLDFNSEERTIYDIFAKNANDRVKVIVGQKGAKLGGKAYVHILQSILRLRLICAHGKDLLNDEDLKVMNGLSKDSAIDLDSDDEDDIPGLSAKEAYDMYSLMKQTNGDTCITCDDKVGPKDVSDVDGDPKDQIFGYMTPCYHIICTKPSCIDEYKATNEEIAQGRQDIYCPTCNQHIQVSYFALKVGGVKEEQDGRLKSKDSIKHTKDLSNYSGPHTKTRALLDDLAKSRMDSEQLPADAPIKSVVFSGWTAHLDLIQLALASEDLKYVRLDGKMTRPARNAAMDQFREDPSVTVMLVSITAGGLGLNLTTANKVYVMEPQYNPAAEAQAVDRVHRLGQKREVTTVRYIMNDSFEEKMLELQEKKVKLAHLSMDSDGKKIDKAEAARKRLEDLRSLFK
jgi:SNF2 family DNA or RNA helicase